MRRIKVPVIMQMEALECGAACLCMIAAYYKKWLPLTKVRKDCGVSRDGSVARNILNAARSYGFESNSYKLEISDLKDIKLPAIIHWNFNHFVVLNEVNFEKQVAYINDPALGRTVVSMDEFDKAFTGILMSFEPNEKFKPEGKPKSVFKFLKKILKNSLTAFIIAGIISFVVSIIAMVSPILDKIFIDDILSGKYVVVTDVFFKSMFVILFLNILTGIIQSTYWLKIEGKFSVISSSNFFWHVLRLPLDFFLQRYIGDVVERQDSTERIAITFIKKIAPLAIDILSLIFYLFFMIKYSFGLTLIGITASIINIFIVNYTSKRITEMHQSASGNTGKLISVTYSAIEMIETIKSTGAESGFFERWAGFYSKQNNAQVTNSNFINFFSEIPRIVSEIARIILQMSAIYLIMKGQFTIGMLMAFNNFLSGFFKPIDNFLDVYQNFVSVKTEMERVDDVLEHELDEVVVKSISKTGNLKTLRGKLEIKNITFGYSILAKPVIKDFSLVLEPGKSVAIIGGSGSGKSTISKLVIGLYVPWSGQILFDGKERKDIDPYEFHGSVSMVDQEKTMFNDTIRNNIKMWDDSIEDFSMILSSRDADIHETIISRKDGYDHEISEGGRDFSGGQCQRIEIARALATEPTILILDEATSALDAKTENTVMKNIKNLGCSCIIIAHRLSTIRNCDEIIVLDRGNIIERGTHEELLKQNMLYKKLVTTE